MTLEELGKFAKSSGRPNEQYLKSIGILYITKNPRKGVDSIVKMLNGEKFIFMSDGTINEEIPSFLDELSALPMEQQDKFLIDTFGVFK